MGWCPLGECLVPRGGTRALLGGRPAGRMQLSGLHEQLCSSDSAFPPCAATPVPALPQTGGAPPGLLLGWVGSVPRLCAPYSTGSITRGFWGGQFAAPDALPCASLSAGVPPLRWRPRSLVSPCFFSSWQWDGEAGWTQPGHHLLGAVSL